MEQRKMWTTALTLVLALTCLSFKCGGGGATPESQRRKFAKAADDIAGAVSAMIDAKRNLAQQGQISADDERRLTQLLTVLNDADTALVNKLKATPTLDAGSCNDLLRLLSQVTSAANSLNSSGVLPIGNADARQRLSKFIATINAALGILAQLQSCSSMPAPTPTATP